MSDQKTDFQQWIAIGLSFIGIVGTILGAGIYIGRASEKIDKLEAKVERIESNPSTSNAQIESRFSKIENQTSDLEKNISNLSLKQEVGGVSLDRVESEISISEKRITSILKNEILNIIDQKISNSPKTIPSNPHSVVRKIHYANEECVYIPSFDDIFSIEFSDGAQFCLDRRVPWFFVDETTPISFNIFKPGEGFKRCESRNKCYVVQEDKNIKYEIKIEKVLKKNGEYIVRAIFTKIT